MEKELTEMVKDEISFLEKNDIPKNKHGAYIFKSQNGKVGLDLQFFLYEYKEWLIENKLVQLK